MGVCSTTLQFLGTAVWVYLPTKNWNTEEMMMMIRLHVSGMTSPSGKCPNWSGKFRRELHSLVPQVLTFTSRTCHATSTELNHPYLLRISNVKKKFCCNSCFPRNAKIDSCVCALLNTAILNSPTKASVFIYPPYIDNLFFLFYIYHRLFVLNFSSQPLTFSGVRVLCRMN